MFSFCVLVRAILVCDWLGVRMLISGDWHVVVWCNSSVRRNKPSFKSRNFRMVKLVMGTQQLLKTVFKKQMHLPAQVINKTAANFMVEFRTVIMWLMKCLNLIVHLQNDYGWRWGQPPRWGKTNKWCWSFENQFVSDLSIRPVSANTLDLTRYTAHNVTQMHHQSTNLLFLFVIDNATVTQKQCLHFLTCASPPCLILLILREIIWSSFSNF